MGNKYFMSCTDLFSKWPVAYALPNKEGITVAKAIIKLITTFGFPSDILSDNGTEFCNELNDEMYRILEIDRRKTAVYHLQTNGQDENTNKNIKRKLVNDNQSNWDEFLDVILYPLRIERQTSTKVSPFEIMFSGHLLVCSSEYKENIEEAQQKQKRYYDERVGINTKIEEEFIAIGDKVLLLDIRGRRSKGAAFKPRFKGPYYVLSVTKCGNFKLTGENKVPLKGTHKRLHIKKFIESKDKERAV